MIASKTTEREKKFRKGERNQREKEVVYII